MDKLFSVRVVKVFLKDPAVVVLGQRRKMVHSDLRLLQLVISKVLELCSLLFALSRLNQAELAIVGQTGGFLYGH